MVFALKKKKKSFFKKIVIVGYRNKNRGEIEDLTIKKKLEKKEKKGMILKIVKIFLALL